MSQSPMGWYEDDDAPGLARWWDGDRWTEHTMVVPAEPTTVTPVVADEPDDEEVLHHFAKPADDAEPLPPRTGPTRFPRVDEPLPSSAAPTLDPTDVGTFEFGALDDVSADNPFFAPEPELEPGVYRPDWLAIDAPAHRRRGASRDEAGDRFARRYRGWPLWARITAPGLAIVLMVGLALAAVHSVDTSSARRTGDTSDATFAPGTSSTTAVTFVPLGPPSSVVDSSSTSAPASTTTTATHTTTTVRATTTTAPTTTVAPTTTSSSTTTTTAPATTTTEVPVS